MQPQKTETRKEQTHTQAQDADHGPEREAPKPNRNEKSELTHPNRMTNHQRQTQT